MAALAIGALDGVAAVVVTFAMLRSIDPATGGLDRLAGFAVLLLFAVTGLPALVLAWRQRAPRAALTLALLFPLAFVALFVAVVVALQ